MKKVILAIIIFLAVVLMLVSGFVIWASSARGPQEEVLSATQPDDLVEVKHDKWIVFSPKKNEKTVGFIFYPGA
jgi:hypothetical protein